MSWRYMPVWREDSNGDRYWVLCEVDLDKAGRLRAWHGAPASLPAGVYALAWLDGLDRRGVEVLRLRAADPAFSYRQIGPRIGVTPARAHQLYRETITAAMRMAAQTEGDGLWT